jgi:phosphoribosyl-AMP cyclohydrolase
MSPMPSGVRIEPSPGQLSAVSYDDSGLVAAIAQDAETKAVLMMAWMNAETLKATLETGRMVY